jgi:hypothetical protein
LSEVFCREDYRAGSDAGRRRRGVEHWTVGAVLPHPQSNLPLLSVRTGPAQRGSPEAQPDGFADRSFIKETAVGPEHGVVSFGREPTGRYGAVCAVTDDVIEVRCLGIEETLESVLACEESIDIMKIDTARLEKATVAAIRPELLDRIKTVYFESLDRRLCTKIALTSRSRTRL